MSDQDTAPPQPPQNPWGFQRGGMWPGLAQLAQAAGPPQAPTGGNTFLPAVASRAPPQFGQPDSALSAAQGGDYSGLPTGQQIPGLVHRLTTGMGRFASPQVAMAGIAGGKAATGYWQAFAAGQEARMKIEYDKWKLASAEAKERQETEFRELNELLGLYGANSDDPKDKARFADAMHEYINRHPDDWVLKNYLEQGGPAAAEALLKHRDSLFLDNSKLLQAQEAEERLKALRRKNQQADEDEKQRIEMEKAAKKAGINILPHDEDKTPGDTAAPPADTGDGTGPSSDSGGDTGADTGDTGATGDQSSAQPAQPAQQVAQAGAGTTATDATDPAKFEERAPQGPGAGPTTQPVGAGPGVSAAPAATAGLPMPSVSRETRPPQPPQPRTVTGKNGDQIKIQPVAKGQEGTNKTVRGPRGEPITLQRENQPARRSRPVPPPKPSNIFDGIDLPEEKDYSGFGLQKGEATKRALDIYKGNAPKTGNRKLSWQEKYQNAAVEQRLKQITDYLNRIEDKAHSVYAQKGYMSNEDLAAADQAVSRVDRNLGATFSQIRRYKLPLQTAFYSSRSPYIQQLTGLMSALDPQFDARTFANIGAFQKQFNEGAGNNQQAQNIRGADTAMQHIADLYKAYKQIGNYAAGHAGAVPANFIRNTFNNIFMGYPEVRDFDTARNFVAEEVRRAFSGSHGSEGELMGILSNLSPNMTDEQMHQALARTESMLYARLNTVSSEYNLAVHATNPFTREADPSNPDYRGPMDFLSGQAIDAMDEMFQGYNQMDPRPYRGAQ